MNIKNKIQQGFTLVEIAIVFVIVGLLVAGVLVGKTVIQSARITTTIQQVNQLKLAVEGFIDKYKQLPGDLEDAQRIIKGCSVACDTSDAGDSAGDGSVGEEDWDFVMFQSNMLNNTKPLLVNARKAETVLFWYELQSAGYINAWVDKTGLTGTGLVVFGESLPAAKIGGGFLVGNSSGSFGSVAGHAKPIDLGRPSSAFTPYPYPMLGTVVKISIYPDPKDVSYFGPVYKETDAAFQVMSPYVAAQIDRKIDDGIPDSGNIHAYGHQSTCYAGTASPYSYAENTGSKDCGLIISIYN